LSSAAGGELLTSPGEDSPGRSASLPLTKSFDPWPLVTVARSLTAGKADSSSWSRAGGSSARRGTAPCR